MRLDKGLQSYPLFGRATADAQFKGEMAFFKSVWSLTT
jgi:hypothetical protein